MKTKNYKNDFPPKQADRWMQIGFAFMVFTIILSMASCKKFVEVDGLKDQLLTEQVFSSDGTANSAIQGIYRSTKDLTLNLNVFASISGNDINYYSSSSAISAFGTYTVQSNSTNLPWNSLYTLVYRANSAIIGLEKSTAMTEAKRLQNLGEAKFLRAYAYFYLVNFFGDVPLLTTTDVDVTSVAKRNTQVEVYSQIITDLSDAVNKLPSDYSLSGGSKTRVNKWAAKGLLARVYLYTKDWTKAAQEASDVIEAGNYTLIAPSAGIFSKNNAEAIFQLDRYSGEPFSLPTYFVSSGLVTACSNNLLMAFENNDKRRQNWVLTKVVIGTPYNVPNKFTSTSTTVLTEFETPLRLAEQYLIRAEARAMENNFSDAIADVNLLRAKHGGLTTPLPTPGSQLDAMNLILKERQVELFAEYAHRWFDLKRTDLLDATMKIERPASWKTTAALYPIPLSDIQRNTNMVQNPGYQ